MGQESLYDCLKSDVLLRALDDSIFCASHAFQKGGIQSKRNNQFM